MGRVENEPLMGLHPSPPACKRRKGRYFKLRQQMSQLVDREAALRAKRDQDSLISAELESIPGRLARVFPPEYWDALAAELEQQVYLILKKSSLNETSETSDDPAAAQAKTPAK